MKNLILKLSLFMLPVNFSFIQSCQKSKQAATFQKCNLSGTQTISVENKEATLVYTNTLSGVGVKDMSFFLINSNIEGIYLPLKVCNFPIEQFPEIKDGDSIGVNFDGRIEVLPETTDASHLTIELKNIKITGVNTTY